MQPAILYIFSGLPATGKSTLASLLALHKNAVFLRIDTIEQGMRDLYGVSIEYEGYKLAHRIASENLQTGISVVCDSCNPLELTRRDWEAVATSANARFVNIETICSDEAVHQHRVETRESTVKNLVLPAWPEVLNREYHSWTQPRIVIDTAHRTIEACFSDLLNELSQITI